MRERLARWFQDYHDGAGFRGRALIDAVLRAAAVGYGFGHYLHRHVPASARRQYRPQAAVIGVGSLTVGGSGKTSLVDYLASRFLASGYRVAVLTRGYGRQTRERIVIEPGFAHQYDAGQTGDEPLLLARHVSAATVVVDADRAGAARDIEQRFRPEVFVLDDAAQYRGIALDCLILTITLGDLHPPFRLLPAGRWREPAHNMRRADAVVLVGENAQSNSRHDEGTLSGLGFRGPCFSFRYELLSWRNLDGTPAGFTSLAEESRVGVFCGVARPAAFFSWLESHGISAAQTWRFADHHRYSPQDLDVLALHARLAGLDFLVTTEKDAIKLARFADPPVRIIYPEVRLSPITGGREFDHFMEQIVERRIHN